MRGFKWIQKPLDWFNSLRCLIVASLAWLSLRVYGREVKFQWIRDGKYPPTSTEEACEFTDDSDLDVLLDASKDVYQGEVKRREGVTDKCKTLLTLSTLLLAVIGLFMSKTINIETGWAKTVFFVAVIALLNVLVIVMVFYDVGKLTQVSIGATEAKMESSAIKNDLIRSYLLCRRDEEYRNNYLVELYGAARFFFLTSFTLIVVLFTVRFFVPASHEKKIITALRGDPELIELLRGPKGKAGPQGPKGQLEDDEIDRIVDRVLNDRRVKKGRSMKQVPKK